MQEAAPAAAASADRAAADLNLDLSAARHVWLSKTTLALLLKSGQLVLTHLIMEAGNVKQMKVQQSLLIMTNLHTRKLSSC